jgi:putative flippase GtrA
MRPESTIKQRTAYFLFLLIGTRFFRFCGTGVIGFTVDAGILSILTKLGHLPTIPSRGLSFSVAVVVTWALNRRWTFCASTRPSCREFLAYIASQAVGLGVNFGIFSLLIISQAPLVGRPLPALGLSSLFSLTINYAGLRIFAFRVLSPSPSGKMYSATMPEMTTAAQNGTHGHDRWIYCKGRENNAGPSLTSACSLDQVAGNDVT